MNKERTGALIKQMRELRGLSQRKLAELSGVDRGYINHLEAGKGGSISLRLAWSLAEALEIRPSLFLQEGAFFEEAIDSEVKTFFSNDWEGLSDDEKDWLRRSIRMVIERKRERIERQADKKCQPDKKKRG